MGCRLLSPRSLCCIKSMRMMGRTPPLAVYDGEPTLSGAYSRSTRLGQRFGGQCLMVSLLRRQGARYPNVVLLGMKPQRLR